jgi:hypothetical protein
MVTGGLTVGLAIPALLFLDAYTRPGHPWFTPFFIGHVPMSPRTVGEALWPAARLLLRTMHAPERTLVLLPLAVLVNVAMYAALGALLWIGLRKNPAALLAIGALVLNWCALAFTAGG